MKLLAVSGTFRNLLCIPKLKPRVREGCQNIEFKFNTKILHLQNKTKSVLTNTKYQLKAR